MNFLNEAIQKWHLTEGLVLQSEKDGLSSVQIERHDGQAMEK